MRASTPRPGRLSLTLTAAMLLAGTALADPGSTGDPGTTLVDRVSDVAQQTPEETVDDALDTVAAIPGPSPHCHGEENPHHYRGAASQAPPRVPLPSVPLPFPSSPFAKAVAQGYAEDGFPLAGVVILHDGASDCHGEGADLTGDGKADLPVLARLALSDGDLESGVGGGFFPAGHHGQAFEVTDASGARVAFTVASDADGDGTLEPGECRETFIRRGETTCAPGADGGWWVVLHAQAEVDGEVSGAPTTGLLVSGPVSLGSQMAELPMLASGHIVYDGATDSFSWSSPAGWDCTPYDGGPTQYSLMCYSPEGVDWGCQNNHVFVVARHDGASSSSATVRGNMECHPYRFAICSVTVNAANPYNLCAGPYYGSGSADPFFCTMYLDEGFAALKDAVVECFNDP